jgi:hypothetical protein
MKFILGCEMKFSVGLVSLSLLFITSHAAAEPWGDCLRGLASDYALQPIADKVALSGSSDRLFSMMANDSYPTATEKAVILDWGNKRERCNSSYPPQQSPVTHLYVEGFRTVQSMIFDLYKGNISYGEFSRRREDSNTVLQARLQQLEGQYQQQHQYQQQQNQQQHQYQQQREDYLNQQCLDRARNQFDRANCGIAAGARGIGSAIGGR